MPGIFNLKGTVKHYDWGGNSYIPTLLQIPNTENRPFAEYWMGVHTQDRSMISSGGEKNILLKDYLSQNPFVLGDQVGKQFGKLPYLLKILDVHSMLSIQVHPSKAIAEEGFKRENEKGIPVDSPHRNYRDDNHKPELLVAMNDFWLLHGFKTSEKLKETFHSVTELKPLLSFFESGGYEGLYRTIMTMPQKEVNATLQPLLERVVPLYRSGNTERSDPGYWAAKAAVTFNNKDIDRGIFSIYFFNLVLLKKGEGIFQAAGVPHAYLEGQNVEIMADSDNVLRGGLTTKHIDVNELLKLVKYEATVPAILKGTAIRGDEIVYKTSAPDFELSSFRLSKEQSSKFSPVTAEIILLIEGKVAISDGTDSIELEAGNPSAIVFPGNGIQLTAHQQSVVFRASVPVNRSE